MPTHTQYTLQSKDMDSTSVASRERVERAFGVDTVRQSHDAGHHDMMHTGAVRQGVPTAVHVTCLSAIPHLGTLDRAE